MSNNIGGNNVAPGMSDPEVAVNDRTGRLDAAITETLSLDVQTADKTPTVNQLQTAIRIAVTTSSTLRTVNLSPVKRLWIIDNLGSGGVKLKMGATEITLAGGAIGLYYADGSDNGLKAQSAGGSNPGTPGGGIEEAPADGVGYVRKDGGWEPETTGGGDPGGGSGGPAWDFLPPTAASLPNLTRVKGGSTNQPLVLTDDADVGLLLDFGPFIAGNKSRCAFREVTGDTDITVKFESSITNQNYLFYGIAIGGSFNNELCHFGWECTDFRNVLVIYRWEATGDSYSGGPYAGPAFTERPKWLRVKYTASSNKLEFFYSHNGKQWVKVKEFTGLTSVGVNAIGIHMATDRAPADGFGNYYLSVPYLKVA